MRVGSLLQSWVAFLDQREHAAPLALLRIGVGLVLLADLLQAWVLGLVVPLFGQAGGGGLADPEARAHPAALYGLLPESPWTGWATWGTLVVASSLLSAGLFTRLAAGVILLGSAQVALMLPNADRGIDMLLRNVLLVLVFAGSGRVWSIDAFLAARWGRPLDPVIPAWPRLILILQVLVMYFTAGVQKVGYTWTPMGHFAALYLILQDWAVARSDFSWVAYPPWFQITQLGTAVTLVWEWSVPLLFLAYYWRGAPDRGGRPGAWCRRWPVPLLWLAIGVVFHLGIALTLQLGIFPWAMLATYVVFFRPDQVLAIRAGRWPAP